MGNARAKFEHADLQIAHRWRLSKGRLTPFEMPVAALGAAALLVVVATGFW